MGKKAAPQEQWERWKERAYQVRPFFTALGNRCQQDRITVTAGHLAYVSLLSLVPFIMVFFAILSAFPAFSGLREQLESFIFSNFVPHAGGQVQEYLGEFVDNATKMSAISIMFLAVVALLLISNVDKTINFIWRTSSHRPRIYTFAIYWMVLTLGPLLMGSSVAISSYLVGLAAFAEDYTPGLANMLLGLAPFISATAAFFLLYMVVPTAKVEAGHALTGALVASVLFEVSKKAFAGYISSFPSYQLIYGAMATVPILFVWIYLSWIVVLVGAEVTVVTQRWRTRERPDEEDPRPDNPHLP